MTCHICGGTLESVITNLPFKVSDDRIVIVSMLPRNSESRPSIDGEHETSAVLSCRAKRRIFHCYFDHDWDVHAGDRRGPS